MLWRKDVAQRRIDKLLREAPAVDVRNFRDDYLPHYKLRAAMLQAESKAVAPPLYNLPKGSAVLVQTIQIYICITNYDDFRLESGSETASSHDRALRFLHLYYSACDRSTEGTDAQRVDFHGSRMHAVVIDENGGSNPEEAIAEALSFVLRFQKVAEQANRQLARNEFDARIRVGIDVGPCVAINNGTGNEQEPLFLGSAANHAAKLAAGTEPGVFVSDAVRARLSLVQLGALEHKKPLSDLDISRVLTRQQERDLSLRAQPRSGPSTDNIVEKWREEIANRDVPDPVIARFAFHYKAPPLKNIDYGELSPSNSIRMPLASVFADLSGYTAYIDNAIAQDSIALAVKALYVIRAEFQNVIEQDFGGRKVRFIGDCIHALLAEGSSTTTDDKLSVQRSLECAGALRSSFELCQTSLPGLSSLGLAIGLEFGATPISRIGIRGLRSVRVASSVATTRSEKMQRECGHNDTRVGPAMSLLIPASVRDLFDGDGSTSDLTYDDIATAMGSFGVQISAPSYIPSPSRNTGNVSRAHSDIL
ncbi:adenylate/guanylate cyclase domain-containing protein [Kordiimonas aestuarii]|uniref:adenylate/guanylate cyclase domain-containing protein n=1 Tax=Kordiimonas aestuarii TaxID=1005925 RepID=UPI0021D091F2|nr:adenylate/guanylate cyclase domain-containing protein [Kordiimonas aestuarii]